MVIDRIRELLQRKRSVFLLPVVVANLVGSNAIKPGGEGSIVANPVLPQILQSLEKNLRGNILGNVNSGYPL